MMRIIKIFGYTPAILVPRAVSLMVVVFFTRILEPAQFGLYSLIIVYGGFLDAVFLNWSRLGLLRFYSAKQENSLTRLMPGSLLILAAGFITGGLASAVLSASSPSTHNTDFFLLLLLYFLGNGLLNFGLNILRTREQLLFYVIVEVLRPVLGFGVAWVMVNALGHNYIRLSQGLFGVTACFGIFLLISVVWKVSLKQGNRQAFMDMVRYSAPLLLVFFWTHFITASDRFFLNYLSGPSAVGMYAASYSLARPVVEILFNVVNLGEFPRLIKTFDIEGAAGAQKALNKTIAYLMFLCLPTLMGLILLAEPLSTILVGEEYRNGAPWVIRLVAMGAFFAGIKSFIFDQIFHLHRKSMAQSLTLLPAAALTILLNVILIPSYGAVGAAWAGVSGYIIAASLSLIYSRRYMKILWPVRDIFWILTATALMGITIHVFQKNPETENLIITCSAACAVYLTVCWKSGVLGIISHSTKQKGSHHS